jgi:putative oxidoreductase
VTGLVIAYFGSQKVFGAFGGQGFQGTLSTFKEHMGISTPFAVCAMAGELLGGLGLTFGVLTRLAAFGVVSVMAVATYVDASAPGTFAHIVSGNPFDSMSKVAFPLLIGVIALAILIMGGGSLTLDSVLWRKRPARRTT